MAKRLQVILADAEYRAVAKAARARHVSIAQWVRDALVDARKHEPDRTDEKKLAALRAATSFDFPTGNIAEMLSEVLSGREETFP